jgi:integrase
MTLAEFFTRYYAPLKLRGRSENTTRLYHCTIKAFKKFLDGREPTLIDLDDLIVSQFLAQRASTRSPFTAEKERTQLLSLWRFAFDRRIEGVTTRPCVPPTPLPERIPTAWAVDSIRDLMRAASKETGMIAGSPASAWFMALISVLWESAERIGSIMSLRVLDYSSPRILVRAEYRKGKKRDKLYSLTPSTCVLIDQIVKGKKPNDKIFAWDKPLPNLWYSFGKVVERAGLGGGRRAKFHQLRRSSATHFASRGGDATALLDHSSPRVTRAYLDPRFLQTGPQPCDVLPSISIEQPAGGATTG